MSMADTPELGPRLEGLNDFREDFIQVVESAKGLRKWYERGEQKLDTYLGVFKKALSLFNKKYPDLKITLKTGEELSISVSLKESTLKTFFTKAASRIKGLQSVGLKRFDEVKMADSARLQALLANVKKALYLTYMGESGSTSFFVEKRSTTITIFAEEEDLVNDNSPEFKLCSYYGLRKKYKKKVDVLNELHQLGFAEVPDEDEYEEHKSRFFPWSRE